MVPRRPISPIAFRFFSFLSSISLFFLGFLTLTHHPIRFSKTHTIVMNKLYATPISTKSVLTTIFSKNNNTVPL